MTLFCEQQSEVPDNRGHLKDVWSSDLGDESHGSRSPLSGDPPGLRDAACRGDLGRHHFAEPEK